MSARAVLSPSKLTEASLLGKTHVRILGVQTEFVQLAFHPPPPLNLKYGVFHVKFLYMVSFAQQSWHTALEPKTLSTYGGQAATYSTLTGAKL